MDDATRKAILRLLDRTREVLHVAPGAAPVMDYLRDQLERDAERTTLVSPEWMDGAEAKRLGFEKVSRHSRTWSVGIDTGTPFMPAVRIELYEGRENMHVQDDAGARAVFAGIPTIRQVRAAVFLATGRE